VPVVESEVESVIEPENNMNNNNNKEYFTDSMALNSTDYVDNSSDGLIDEPTIKPQSEQQLYKELGQLQKQFVKEMDKSHPVYEPIYRAPSHSVNSSFDKIPQDNIRIAQQDNKVQFVTGPNGIAYEKDRTKTGQLVDPPVTAIKQYEEDSEIQSQRPLIVMNNPDLKTHRQVLLQQGYNSTPGLDKPNIGKKITYPAADDTLRYDGNGCYRDINTTNIRKLTGKQINKRNCRPYDDKIVEGAVNTLKHQGFFSPMSNAANDIRYENIHFQVPTVYMGVDPYISGVSYAMNHIELPADVDQVGSIPVNDYRGEPMPYNGFYLLK
jgi:hypothetical protein